MRSRTEQDRVNLEFDKITGDTFWNHFGYLYTRYHKDLDVWDYDDAGTLNAVHEFLRSLGVRWFAPGELGEVVPRQTTIALPAVSRTVTPDFGMRRFTFYTDHTGIGDKGIWTLRLGLNQGHGSAASPRSVTGLKFAIMREEMKQAHPGDVSAQRRQTRHHDEGQRLSRSQFAAALSRSTSSIHARCSIIFASR